MIKLSAIALAAGLAVSAASVAHADEAVTGAWNYKVGTTGTSCKITLTATTAETAGDVASADDCATGLTRVGHWKSVGSNLQLLSPAGNLVAVLRVKDGAYSGAQIGGGRTVTLTR